MSALFLARCGCCAARSRPAPPLAPLFVELATDGYHADYQCPNPICGAGWYAMWNPDALDAGLRPYPGERAA